MFSYLFEHLAFLQILAAQSDMVTRFLDIDRDRQNRLENRLDHLLNVVHASVLNKSPEKDAEMPPSLPEPRISRLIPPPKPGTVPPKLDLVPPKPCRVPCTLPNSKIELINQNPLSTRPGVVTPIMSPNGKLGTIWSKLGPVSQSPFIRAQMQLGFQPYINDDVRTQSSAERRIAKQTGLIMDTKTLISETATFLEAERRLDEKIENAKCESGMDLNVRKKLFTQYENNAGIILSAAFIQMEKEIEELIGNGKIIWGKKGMTETRGGGINNLNPNPKERDGLVTGQGEGYEYLKQLGTKSQYVNEPMDSSTPAKPPRLNNGNQLNSYAVKREPERRVNFEENEPEPSRQTIQQLAQLVMNSARWRNTAIQHQQNKNNIPAIGFQTVPQSTGSALNNNIASSSDTDSQGTGGNNLNRYSQFRSESQGGNLKPSLTNNDRYSYAGQPSYNGRNAQTMGNNMRASYNGPIMSNQVPMGFTTNNMLIGDDNVDQPVAHFGNQMGFVNNCPLNYKQQKRYFPDVDGDRYIDQRQQLQQVYNRNFTDNGRNTRTMPPFMTSNGQMVMAQTENMIRHYVHGAMPGKTKDDKETDSDNDDVFLDTTASMPPSSSRRTSLTSMGTAASVASSKSGKTDAANCIIS